MTVVRSLIVLGVVISLALSGPLAPFAGAQQPSAPPRPGQPDVFQEPLKTTAQVPPGSPSYQPPPTMEPVSTKPADTTLDEKFYERFASVATGFLIPGRAFTCGLGGIVAGGLLLFTLGSAYRAATRVMEEGCGGKWKVTADDLRSTRSMIDVPVQSY